MGRNSVGAHLLLAHSILHFFYNFKFKKYLNRKEHTANQINEGSNLSLTCLCPSLGSEEVEGKDSCFAHLHWPGAQALCLQTRDTFNMIRVNWKNFSSNQR